MSETLFPFVVVAAVIFSAAALITLVRVVRGPTILDRMIASDVLFTVLLLALGVVMVVDEAYRTIVIMLVLSATAFLSTIAVARYVSKQDRAGESPLESADRDASTEHEEQGS
jgi:multicomponent Na+:H+ antiporter subunit F